jgi:hypothetical protein
MPIQKLQTITLQLPAMSISKNSSTSEDSLISKNGNNECDSSYNNNKRYNGKSNSNSNSEDYRSLPPHKAESSTSPTKACIKLTSQQEIAVEIQALKEKAKVMNLHLVAIHARMEALGAKSRELGGEDGESCEAGDGEELKEEGSRVYDGNLLRFFPSRNDH